MFIVLVLVAAIGAGLLVNTAGFLQTQAKQISKESTSQIANNINVIGEVGVVNSTLTPYGINETRLTVQRSPGSDNVDLTELSIQYVGDNGFANYIHASQEDDVDNPHYIVQITSASVDGVMADNSDRYQLVIPFASANENNIDDIVGNLGSDTGTSAAPADINRDLTTGEEAELEITTADRSTRNAFIQVPDTIEDGESSVML